MATGEGWVFANPRTNRPYYPTDEGAAGTDATRFYPDDDERLWTRMSSSKREANGKVVEMVIKPFKASA